MTGQTIKAEYVRSQRHALKPGKTFSPYKPILAQLSLYFRKIPPSLLDGNVIKETELLLLDLEDKSDTYRWDDSLQKAIQEALGPLGNMSFAIAGNIPPLTHFYADRLLKYARELGRALALLSLMT